MAFQHFGSYWDYVAVYSRDDRVYRENLRSFLGMLMTLTFPAVIVDAVYAAIYIRKHPEYEEL